MHLFLCRYMRGEKEMMRLKQQCKGFNPHLQYFVEGLP